MEKNVQRYNMYLFIYHGTFVFWFCRSPMWLYTYCRTDELTISNSISARIFFAFNVSTLKTAMYIFNDTAWCVHLHIVDYCVINLWSFVTDNFELIDISFDYSCMILGTCVIHEADCVAPCVVIYDIVIIGRYSFCKYIWNSQILHNFIISSLLLKTN